MRGLTDKQALFVQEYLVDLNATQAASRRGDGMWSEQDAADIGDAIKASIAAKDAVMVACWSGWLADLSAWVTAWNLICRGSERRMMEAAQAHIDANKAAKGSK